VATLSLLLSVATTVPAGEVMNARPGGLAVKGYDVVAYFTDNAPVLGSEDIEFTWREVRWRFANEEHREIFRAEPQRYAPRYGGFCAGGVALGRTSPIDPEAFAIVDGKLYLGFDKAVADEIRQAPEKILPKADENWAKMNEEESG
jgi:hypothetical protein